MDRRDLLKLCGGLALPSVKSIEVANVQPHDVIVFESGNILSQSDSTWVKETLGEIWPNNEIVVLGKGDTIKVIRSIEVVK